MSNDNMTFILVLRTAIYTYIDCVYVREILSCLLLELAIGCRVRFPVAQRCVWKPCLNKDEYSNRVRRRHCYDYLMLLDVIEAVRSKYDGLSKSICSRDSSCMLTRL